MGETVNLDVTTLEESVSVNVTEEGEVEINVVAEKGDTGPTGPQGPAGPNEVTSATTTNFTSGQVLFANGANVGSLSRSGIDTRTSFPNDDVTAASTSGANNALVRFTANGDIGLVGNTRAISVANTLGTNEVSILAGGITLTGGSGIQSTGANATITTTGANGRIFTTGANAHIETTNSGAYIQTRSSFRYFDTPTGSVMTLAFASLTTDRTITFPNNSGTVALTSQLPTLGTGVATFLATPTSANLAAAVSDETGSGSLVFANSPTLTNATASTSVTNSPALIVSGPTSSVDTLQVRGAATNSFSSIGLMDNSNVQRGSFGYGGSAASSYASTVFFNAGSGIPMSFGTNALERMRLTTGGELGIGTTTPSSRAILDLTSTTKGFLPPRMTTAQRDAITSVPAGLMIYNTSTNKLNFYNGSAWEVVTSS